MKSKGMTENKESLTQVIVKQTFKGDLLPVPVFEYKFHPDRKWMFDYAWPEQKIAMEVEGGIFMKTRSGHSSITGILRDIEKYNAATILGWRIIRVVPSDVLKTENIDTLKNLIRETLKNKK